MRLIKLASAEVCRKGSDKRVNSRVLFYSTTSLVTIVNVRVEPAAPKRTSAERMRVRTVDDYVERLDPP